MGWVTREIHVGDLTSGMGGKQQAFHDTYTSVICRLSQVLWDSKLDSNAHLPMNPPSGPLVLIRGSIHEEGPWFLKDTHTTKVEATKTEMSLVLVGSSLSSLS